MTAVPPALSPWKDLGAALGWLALAFVAAACAVAGAIWLRAPGAASGTIVGLPMYLVLALPLARSGMVPELMRRPWTSVWPVIGYLFVAGHAGELWVWLLGLSPPAGKVLQRGTAPVPVAWLLADMLVMTVVGPVIEELFFRGWLWARLARSWPVPVVAAVTGTLFAAIHGPTALHVVPLTVAFTVLRWRDGGVRAPMLLHFVSNALIGLAQVLQIASRP